MTRKKKSQTTSEIDQKIRAEKKKMEECRARIQALSNQRDALMKDDYKAYTGSYYEKPVQERGHFTVYSRFHFR